jgi:hypothetical protein
MSTYYIYGDYSLPIKFMRIFTYSTLGFYSTETAVSQSAKGHTEMFKFSAHIGQSLKEKDKIPYFLMRLRGVVSLRRGAPAQ